MFPGLDLYYADPAQPLIIAGEELYYVDYLYCDLHIRRVKPLYLECGWDTMPSAVVKGHNRVDDLTSIHGPPKREPHDV